MRKKFLVCILLPCCILIAACGHTADTKNDLLSENITSDTETDTQTSDYEKYNNYGSTEEQMDEAITETSETASSSEENDLPEQSLQKYSDDWDESQILLEKMWQRFSGIQMPVKHLLIMWMMMTNSITNRYRV